MIEKDAFPSDHYAVHSQIRLHGYEPDLALIELSPREDEKILRHEDIISEINVHHLENSAMEGYAVIKNDLLKADDENIK